jgi:hypothetical protein
LSPLLKRPHQRRQYVIYLLSASIDNEITKTIEVRQITKCVN